MSEKLARPRVLEAEKSGDALVQKLGASIRDVTVADAAAKTGLALRDAEKGLHWALAEYRGHVRVTEGGDLVFNFPTGFTRPWAAKESFQAWLSRVGKSAWNVLKISIKAWIGLSIVFYTAAFVVLLIGLTFASQGRDSDRDDDRGFSFGSFLMWRLVIDLLGDALWATFHYRSLRDYEESSTGRYGRQQKPRKRLYLRIYQFIFGAENAEPDPLEDESRVVNLIRMRAGRIGLADVMAVTGLVQADAERLITRLLVDYEGEIEVSEEGAVFYVFKEVRKTVDSKLPERVTMAWERPVKVPELTGDNGAGTNLVVAALNTFNLAASGFVTAAGLTIANMQAMIQGIPPHRWPDTSEPLLFGWIPLVYSIGVFTVPIGRWFVRRRELAKAALENGKRAVLQLITRDPATAHPPERLQRAFENGAGQAPSEKQLDRLLLELGGDLQVTDAGQARWRFPELSREAAALAEARAEASEGERALGPVVYSSED